MRVLLVIMAMLCMLLAVSGKPMHRRARQQGVPCALLDLAHPGGWSGVSRSGHTCYVSQPPAAGLTADARRVMGRAVRGAELQLPTTRCQCACLLPRAGVVANRYMGDRCLGRAVYAETMRATDRAYENRSW